MNFIIQLFILAAIIYHQTSIMLFQFKIQIKNITHPPVWRRVVVPSNYSFIDFHIIIQDTFGWFNVHLFHFSPNGYGSIPMIKIPDEFDMDESLDASEIKLSDIFEKENQKYTYIYDFGDDWIHSIILEKILPEFSLFPKLIAGKGQCPPEDCGGPWGYKHLKEVLSNPESAEYKKIAEWYGLEDEEVWDPKEFDLSFSQSILSSVFMK